MTNTEKQVFASKFIDLFLAGGFGSMTKREIDLAVFHLLREAKEYRNKSNYEVANLLKIPETRVKSLRLASALKYEDINSKSVLGKIVMRLSENKQFAIFENGKVEISLEDPIEKREMVNYLKSKGHHAEYSFNSEILKISPVRLFELIIDNMEKGADEFDRLVQEYIDDNAISDRILDGAPTIKQKFNRLRKETLNATTLTSLVSGALGAYIA